MNTILIILVLCLIIIIAVIILNMIKPIVTPVIIGGNNVFGSTLQIPRYDKNNIVFVLFHGFGSSSFEWSHEYTGSETIKRHDFLDNLKKLGNVFTFDLIHFNVDYYYIHDDLKEREKWQRIYDKYKVRSSNIDFTLEDLDYSVICKKVYQDVRQKYPHQKLIPIGHSYGAGLAQEFSKLYTKECLFMVSLDGIPLSEDDARESYKYVSKYKKMVDKYFNNNENLRKSLYKIKTSMKPNKEIVKVMNMIGYNSTMYRIKNVTSKLYVPTLFFKRTSKKYKSWTSRMIKESELIKKNNPISMYKYIWFGDIPHALWYDQKASNEIIKNIREIIRSENYN